MRRNRSSGTTTPCFPSFIYILPVRILYICDLWLINAILIYLIYVWHSHHCTLLHEMYNDENVPAMWRLAFLILVHCSYLMMCFRVLSIYLLLINAILIYLIYVRHSHHCTLLHEMYNDENVAATLWRVAFFNTYLLTGQHDFDKYNCLLNMLCYYPRIAC